MKTRTLTRVAAAIIAMITMVTMITSPASAAGTLTARGAAEQPIRINSHHVNVVLNNGFAHTEVIQTFHNPNPVDLEAVYVCPVPISACLSEVTITVGEDDIHGEVLTADHAERLYEEETKKGNDAGLAKRNGYQTFEFRVGPVRAESETTVRYTYYQPISIDLGVGRYLYPLEEGGTDDAGASFWTQNQTVDGTFSVNVELKSAQPVVDVRVPGFGAAVSTEQLGEGHYKVRLETTDAKLNNDFVLYYRLADDLPGRLDVIPFRAPGDEPGTFMMVLTPGIDLQPLRNGSDYTFVLDISGSMRGKLHALTRGVSQVLGQMPESDRFRIVTFGSRARDLTGGWRSATPENVARTILDIEKCEADGSTNLYDGVRLALRKLDDDRATSIILITDAVTNTGVVDPAAFETLMSKYDVRVFGFLMGNSANWPLMRTICDATGGFYAQVSNADDIVGQIMVAKGKVTHECLHDAKLKIKGVKVHDTTSGDFGKIYRGQQLIFFGRYDEPGQATITLSARLTGEDKTYTTTAQLPDVDIENPELERLWAMSQIEMIEADERRGRMDASEARTGIEYLGVEYQLVTDHTSMVVLSDQAFEGHGIERRNQERTTLEHAAQTQRRAAPVKSYRSDTKQKMFPDQAPRTPSGGGGGGGGAIDPITALIVVSGLGAVAAARRRRRHGTEA